MTIANPAIASALQAVRDAVSTLGPEDQTRVNYALQALEPVVADELAKATDTYAEKLPVFGPIVDGVVKSAIAKALQEGLDQLTAAKAKIGEPS